MRLRGFTIVELMVIMAIVVILAAVAVPMYNSYIATAKMSQAQTTINSMLIRSQAQFLSDGVFMSQVSDLGLPPDTDVGTTPVPVTVDDYIAPYLAQVLVAGVPQGFISSNSCAYGLLTGIVSGLNNDPYTDTHTGQDLIKIYNLMVYKGGKIQNFCYSYTPDASGLYAELTVPGCTKLTTDDPLQEVTSTILFTCDN